jgi:hypothetical protein
MMGLPGPRTEHSCGAFARSIRPAHLLPSRKSQLRWAQPVPGAEFNLNVGANTAPLHSHPLVRLRQNVNFKPNWYLRASPVPWTTFPLATLGVAADVPNTPGLVREAPLPLGVAY